MIAFIDGEYRGLAEERTDMVTDGIRNMEKFVEVDSGKIYYFDAEQKEWVEFGSAASDSSDSNDDQEQGA